MAKPTVDDNSVDWTISGYKDGVLRYKPVLDVQIKCTGDDEYLRTDTIAFDLEQKNYNDLCDAELMYPRILIVVVVPRHVNRWVVHTEGQMSLHYCGYWKSIKGEAPTNQTTKRVHLNRTNVLNVEGLQTLMTRIGMTGDVP